MEINFNKVNYTYNLDSKFKKKALNDITLNFKEGRINGIIGRSGSGKTTLAELIDALILPTSGNIKVGDFIIDKKNKIKNINDLRSKIGFMFQFPEEQFFNIYVKDEIAFGIKNFQVKTADILKRCSDALLMVGLDDSYLDKKTFELSSGQMRKVALASILVCNPKILVLDEPTIGLDSLSKKNLVNLIKKLKYRYHKTIIIITHDLDLLNKLADYIYVLDKGNLVLEGEKYEVFSNPKLLEYGIEPPKIIAFEKRVYELKKIKLGYRDDINDLLKDIYRHAK